MNLSGQHWVIFGSFLMGLFFLCLFGRYGFHFVSLMFDFVSLMICLDCSSSFAFRLLAVWNGAGLSVMLLKLILCCDAFSLTSFHVLSGTVNPFSKLNGPLTASSMMLTSFWYQAYL